MITIHAQDVSIVGNDDGTFSLRASVLFDNDRLGVLTFPNLTPTESGQFAAALIDRESVKELSFEGNKDTIFTMDIPEEANNSNKIEPQRDCGKCVFTFPTCGDRPKGCKTYKRDPPDGGYYG